MNVVVFEGNLVKDPELKTGPSGNQYLQFTLADTYKRSDDPGEGNTTFLPCVVFGDLAANLAASVAKGMRVEVTGRISQSNWTVKDEAGNESTRSRLECVVNSAGVSLRWARAVVSKVGRNDSVPPDEAVLEAANTPY